MESTDANDYADASDTILYNDSMHLLDTINETQMTFHLFFNNRFELAEERMKAHCDKSIYHACGLNTIKLIKATMTCEKDALEDAMDTCKRTLVLVESRRQKWTITDSVYALGGGLKTKTISATDEELHAELCYAETLLFRAVLSFFQDESLTSFVRGALRIRTCHQTYKACHRLIETSAVWEGRDRRIKDQFESGVRLGIGCFNLMLSILPAKVLRLLEVVGFSGNKEVGFAELHRCASMDKTLRSNMGIITLLAWHLIGCYLLGIGTPDLELCHQLLLPLTYKYPNGFMVLFLRARLNLLKGDISGAIRLYNQSIRSQDSYKQFHHGCYWELLFAHSYIQEWHIAASYARRLVKESRWSRTVYLYLLSILIAADDTVEEKKRDETVQCLLGKVDLYRTRIAGKSIPLEKFCSRRAMRGQRLSSLFFTRLEFIYFWSGFDIIGTKKSLLVTTLKHVEDEWKVMCQRGVIDVDDGCLYHFVKGVLLRLDRQLRESEKNLSKVIENEQSLTDLSYLIPNAHFELGQIYMIEGRLREAEATFNTALKYRSYSLENKLHFRIHGAMFKLEEEKSRTTNGPHKSTSAVF